MVSALLAQSLPTTPYSIRLAHKPPPPPLHQPRHWHFAAIEMVRRVALTSGLLLMPSPRTALCLAIVLNLGFGWLYTEANPFFEDWTGSVRGCTT